MVSAVLGLSLLAPLGIVSAAQAAPRPAVVVNERFHGWHHDYRVFYRRTCFGPWFCYGNYRSRFTAEHAVHDLQCRGFEAYMQ
jgi:hypothetical protein